MEEVERHAVPPDRRSPLDDDQRPAGDLRQGRQRLGGGDGGGDADGVEDGSGGLHDHLNDICQKWSLIALNWAIILYPLL